MLLKAVIVCCLIAATLAADDHHKSKKKDPRKRNLDHNLSYQHFQNPSYRSERRISLGPHLTRFPSFFPGRQGSFRKGRPQSLPPPPYAVQMEPLVQYSQRDPLYDPNLIHVPPVNQNDLSKGEDQTGENNHVSENVYGPPKHVIERPIYIREPEPIIEIIIKESNVTHPPVEVPVVTPATKKKEQVQVFYVKYKKNPHGKGKDSIIYETPIPAISPPIEDEEPPHYEEYKQTEYITSAPPASTTLRAIIKPDSETYHANKGIHITFGKEHTQEQVYDDLKEESAPEPAVSLPQSQPQGREFNGRLSSQTRHESFHQDIPRTPQAYRPFNQPPQIPPSAPSPSQFPQFGRRIPTSQIPPTRNPPPPHSAPFPSRHPPTSNRNVPPPFQHFQKPSFNQPPPPGANSFRQPVPYQPFDQVKSQDNQFQFPRTHSHFPVRQQLPLNEPPVSHNQHQLQHRPEQQLFNQQLPLPQSQQGFIQQIRQQPSILSQSSIQLTPNVQQNQQFQQANREEILRQQHLQEQVKQHEKIKQQQLQLQQQFQQQKNQEFQQAFPPQAPFVPPGGELIESVPKYEQHYSVGPNGQLQPQETKASPQQHRQQEQNRQFLSSNEFKQQVQQQFRQAPPSLNHEQLIQQQFRQTAPTQIIPTQAVPTLNPEQSKVQNAQLPLVEIQPSQETVKLNSPHQFEDQKVQIEQIQKQNQQLEQLQLQREKQLQQFQQQLSQQFVNTQNRQPVFINNNQPPPSTTHRIIYQTTTPTATPTTERTPQTTTKDPKELNLQLPDEVPDDLRQHLLSSGILNNADISVLDYDKVGDIPLSALPPDQLANFYGAGGGAQLAAGSAPAPVYVRPEIEKDLETEASENSEIKLNKPSVEMKVVRYDPESEEGKDIQDSYVKDDAKQVDPVELSDSSYNRYLPLRVSGSQFPIPDIPELKGKKINSVVVLAPVDYNFEENTRATRDTKKTFDGVKFPNGSPLKRLIDNPSGENFNKFLEVENKTSASQQSVILLVTGSPDGPKEDREIFMYDVATQSVSKLSGELSSAFVEAAEANTDDTTVAASNLVEVRVPSPKNLNPDRIDEIPIDLEDSPSNIIESKVRIIDPAEVELEPEASEQLERFVDISGADLEPSDDRKIIVENDVESNYRES